MLATYQYFTSKRSSDTVLNKDELRLQAELNCMKQYQNFASTRNEYIKITGDTQFVSLKAPSNNPDDKDHVSYVCTGSDATGDEELYVTKYCLNASKQAIVSCDSLKENKSYCTDAITGNDEASTVGFHCVSTTKWKQFDNNDKYLSAYIIKNGVNIATQEFNPDGSEEENNAKPYLIKGFYANFKNVANKENKSPIGLVSCVNACKVLRQTELENITCEDGSSPVEVNGTYVCAKSTNRSPCTAHEDEYETLGSIPAGKFAKENSTLYCTKDENSNKYCCAKNFYAGNTKINGVIDCTGTNRPSNCCPRDTIPEWQGKLDSMNWEENSTRYWVCKDKTDVNKCKGSVLMKIVDEKGNLISALGNNGYATVPDLGGKDPGIIQYKQIATGGKYYCTLNKTDFIKICRSFESQNYSFLKVTGVDYTYDGETTSAESFENIKRAGHAIFTNLNKAPTCHLISKNNAKSAENCNPCQYAYFNKEANKWTCGNYSLSDLKAGSKNGVTLIDENGTGGSLVKTTAKGVSACLSTCSVDQLKKIRVEKKTNGKYWGLTYNDKTKMWGCFSCNPFTHSNWVWGCSNKEDPTKNCSRDKNAKENNNSKDLIMDENTTHKQITANRVNNAEQTTTCTCNVKTNWTSSLDGKCIPFSCDDSYQVMIRGICYTKWCRRDNEIFTEGRADTGTPKQTSCKDVKNFPWVVYNPVKSCIYCIKPLQ